MVITKTKFINFIRCPRYVALDKIKKNQTNTDVSLKDYKDEELKNSLLEILNSMYDEDDNDLIDTINPQLEVMLPYYNKIEVIAGNYVDKLFKTESIYSKNTLNQESFDFNSNGFKYLCYVDIYTKTKKAFNITEVKATTSKEFLKLGFKNKEKEFIPLFLKNKNGIYEENTITSNEIKKAKAKLYDKYNKCGHYVYDLCVQRYIIEKDLKQNNEEDKIKDVKYYLAVLNSNYIFDGEYINNEPNYKKDLNGNDIITLFDMTNITSEMMEKIDSDRIKIENYIIESDASPCLLGKHCEIKKVTKCKFNKICFKKLPEHNSILNYMKNSFGFKDEEDNKYDTFDLINDNIVHMLDVPVNYLNRPSNVIQREVLENCKTYINKNKIKDGIKCINYPIYHLDFETFPCPLPRFRNEKCYAQSVFQFSLHIEKKPGVCDKEKDHFEFLVSNHEDKREELVKALCKYITNFNGTILVYNQSFEKTRIKELMETFPEYKEKLNKMRNMIFDLLYIVSTNKKLYEELGYSEEEAALFNYYDSKLDGSFSIKKVLPIFSDLSYKNLDVSNGNDAIVTYAKFSTMKKNELEINRNNLLEYCKQDTWAMVEILNRLREISK